MNGTMSRDARDQACRSFQTDEGPDVLLLSDVGGQGLNLFRGSIVVFIVSIDCAFADGVLITSF